MKHTLKELSLYIDDTDDGYKLYVGGLRGFEVLNDQDQRHHVTGEARALSKRA